jgi:hypothetical protein
MCNIDTESVTAKVVNAFIASEFAVGRLICNSVRLFGFSGNIDASIAISTDRTDPYDAPTKRHRH